MTSLNKKMLRAIRQSPGQTLAVAAVVLVGTACYITLASLHRNLLLTRDTYYSQYRFADFEIMVERTPMTALFKVEEIPGVRQVRGRIVKEVNLDIEGVEETRMGRLVSMPDRHAPVLNDVVIRSGRYFDEGALDEVIVSERFAQGNGLEVGDRVGITVNGRKHQLRVVGHGLSPEYVYVIRNIQELVPAPERFGIFWVPESFAEMALDMQAARNNIIGAVDDTDQLDVILDQAEAILESYGVFAKIKKQDQLSNRFISDEITGLGVSARIVPSIFLGVAALVILVLLNRMVRNERTQIGLMKAYGYSNFAVVLHYLQFALILSAAGCFGGFFLGQFLASQMIKLYVQYYQFPILESRVYPDVMARAMAIAIGFSVAGALAAAIRAGRINPAESMRPETPRIGHRVWLENVSFVWRRMSFTWKMIARNVARSKFRSGLNAFGVMLSAGLLVVGYFSVDGINYILEFEYSLTRREDVKVSFITERGKEALYEAARFDHVREAEPLLQYPFEMRNGWRKKDVVVFGLPRDARLQKLVDSAEREVDVDERGLVLSKRLAQDLGVGPGDVVRLKPLMGRITKEKDVPVGRVVEQFFGASGYMNIEALSRVLDESYAVNAVLLRTEPGAERELTRKLKDVPGVAAAEVKLDSYESLVNTLAQSMWIMNTMIIVFAGVIAFAIIYNVTSVSLAERQRELASLRVLGFTNQEVGAILYNENFVTGVIGLMLGTPFGMLLSRGMVSAYDTDLYRFPFHIEPRTVLVANLLTIGFIVVSNLAVRHKIRRLDLVEVLKQRE